MPHFKLKKNAILWFSTKWKIINLFDLGCRHCNFALTISISNLNLSNKLLGSQFCMIVFVLFSYVYQLKIVYTSQYSGCTESQGQVLVLQTTLSSLPSASKTSHSPLNNNTYKIKPALREDTHFFSGQTTKRGGGQPPWPLSKNPPFFYKRRKISPKIGEKEKNGQNPFQAKKKLSDHNHKTVVKVSTFPDVPQAGLIWEKPTRFNNSMIDDKTRSSF